MFRSLLSRSLRALLLPAAALSVCAAPVVAQPTAQAAPAAAPGARLHVTALPTVPRSVLYIGSSFFYYNNGLNGLVSRMLKAAAPDQKLSATLVAISGSGLDWHDVESYFRPDAIGRYSFDDNNVVSFNPPADHPFDAAVMMDCSQCPIHPNLKGIFTDYARRHADTVRRHGAQPVFFMSWAYADKREMTAGLAEAYTRAGNDNNALVIPAGLAFARVVREHPEINLYADDKRHPSLAGSYLAAAVTFETLLGRSPVGNTYLAGLDPAVAHTLQDAAHATMREYLDR